MHLRRLHLRSNHLDERDDREARGDVGLEAGEVQLATADRMVGHANLNRDAVGGRLVDPRVAHVVAERTARGRREDHGVVELDLDEAANSRLAEVLGRGLREPDAQLRPSARRGSGRRLLSARDGRKREQHGERRDRLKASAEELWRRPSGRSSRRA